MSWPYRRWLVASDTTIERRVESSTREWWIAPPAHPKRRTWVSVDHECTVTELLQSLLIQGAELASEGGKLKVHAREDVLRPDVVESLRQNKAEILRILPELQFEAPLSAEQEGLWFIQRTAADTSAYNVGIPLRVVSSDDDGPRLRRALQKLVDRHSLLRTTYTAVDGSPRQVIRACRAAPLVEVDVPGASWAEVEAAAAEIQRPFDLEAEGAFRARLLRRGPGEAPQSNINFALNYSGEFVLNLTPSIYVPCYVNGDPLAGGTAGSRDAFIGAGFTWEGRPISNGPPNVAPNPIHLASASQIWSTYGVAFSRQSQKIFTSSYLKRHVGLGPLGPGGIYQIDPSTGTVTNFQNLHDINIFTSDVVNPYVGNTVVGTVVPFSPVVGSNVHRGLLPSSTLPNVDAQAWEQVG